MFWHKGAIAIRVITSQTISLYFTLFEVFGVDCCLYLGFLLLLYFFICRISGFASGAEFDLMITMFMRVLQISLCVEIPADVHIRDWPPKLYYEKHHDLHQLVKYRKKTSEGSKSVTTFYTVKCVHYRLIHSEVVYSFSTFCYISPTISTLHNMMHFRARNFIIVFDSTEKLFN